MPRHRPIKDFLFRHVLPGPVYVLIGLWSATWRWQIIGAPLMAHVRRLKGPMLGCFWHGRLAHLVPYCARPDRRPWTAMISRSRDGELQGRVLLHMGFRIVRGSSGRGGARALLELLRLVRREPAVRMCVAIDGSRGPRHQVQPGVITLAMRSQAWILPGASEARPALVFRSWDRFSLPLPCARVRVAFALPYRLPPDLDAAGQEQARCHLEALLGDLQQRLRSQPWP